MLLNFKDLAIYFEAISFESEKIQTRKAFVSCSRITDQDAEFVRQTIIICRRIVVSLKPTRIFHFMTICTFL